MRARIINTYFVGIYANEFFVENANNIIDGQLVSKWETTEIIPTQEQIKNGFKFINNAWADIRTPEEIEAIELQEKKQQVKIFIEKKKQDGLDFFHKVEVDITMELTGLLLVDLVPTSNEIDTILYKPLNFIKGGDFFSALMLFQNPKTVIPTMPLVLNYWNDIKVFCLEFFDTNYPKFK